MATVITVNADNNGGFSPTPSAFEPTAFALALGWYDLTADLTEAPIAIQRGFQSTAPDDLVAAPAICQFGLNNSVHNGGGLLGYYSPDSVNARVGFGLTSRLRVQVTANGHTRTRFLGWVNAITPVPGLFFDQVVEIRAASWLQVAQETPASGLTVQITQRGDQLLAQLVAVASLQPPATQFATGLDTYPYAFDDLDPTAAFVIDGIDSVAKSGLDRVWEKADGTLVYETRALRVTGAPNVLNLTDVAPAGYPGLALTTFPVQRTRAAIANQFQVTVHPKAIDAAPVVLYAYQTSASSAAIAAGTSITLDAPYQDPAQLAQRVGGFNMLVKSGAGSAIGTSGDLPPSDWSITSAPAGAGTDLSASCTVTVTYEATKATLVLTNNSGSTGYIAFLHPRGQAVYDYQTVIGQARNASSSAALGRRSVTVDCPYQAVPTFAQTAANYLLAIAGTERSQLDAGISADAAANDELSVDLLLGVEISDPIGTAETVTGLAGSYWINAIQETYDERANLAITYRLAPVWSGAVWQVGVAGKSELGSTTIVSPI